MPIRMQTLFEMSRDTSNRITSSDSEWMRFLQTAAKLYKYPFPDQLMIYAQKPDASACADYKVWTERMRRYVRHGARGIALLDYSLWPAMCSMSPIPAATCPC